MEGERAAHKAMCTASCSNEPGWIPRKGMREVGERQVIADVETRENKRRVSTPAQKMQVWTDT